MLDWLRQLELDHPHRLYALLVVPLLFYFSVASVTALPRWRRITSAICRSMLIAAVIVAWSGVWHRGLTNQAYTMFVTDRSESVDSSQVQMQTNHSPSARIVFGKQPRLITDENKPENLDQATSDPGAAVLLAAGSFPAGYVPNIVLQTDGNETAGDLLAAAQAADILKHRAFANDYEKLIIVAPPGTLGEMRKHYHKEVESRLAGEIAKDLVNHPIADIERIIADN